MLLVPRQLLRSGMTGSVPYYGGRFTPAQAWAAAHPTAPPMGSPAGGSAVAAVRRPLPPAEADASSNDEPATKAALRQLHESGVLTDEEYDELLRRTNE